MQEQKKYNLADSIIRKRFVTYKQAAELYSMGIFDDYMEQFREPPTEVMGYEIKRSKHIAIRGEEQKGFIRIDSLGEGYRESDFEKIFKGEESFNPPPREKQPHRYEKPEKEFDMLIDIQEIIAKGKGPGYECWVKVHNIKQISQTLIYLRDHDIRDMDELAKRAGESSAKFTELSQMIKDAEKRLAEIAVLKTHMINYSKTIKFCGIFKR